jgi:hypothetical protein
VYSVNKYEAALAGYRRKYFPRLCEEPVTEKVQMNLFDEQGPALIDRWAVDCVRSYADKLQPGVGLMRAIEVCLKGFTVARSDGTTYEYQLK